MPYNDLNVLSKNASFLIDKNASKLLFFEGRNPKSGFASWGRHIAAEFVNQFKLPKKIFDKVKIKADINTARTKRIIRAMCSHETSFRFDVWISDIKKNKELNVYVVKNKMCICDNKLKALMPPKMLQPKKNKVASTPRHDQQLEEVDDPSTEESDDESEQSSVEPEDSIVENNNRDEIEEADDNENDGAEAIGDARNPENVEEVQPVNQQAGLEVHQQEVIPENVGRHELPALPPGFTPMGFQRLVEQLIVILSNAVNPQFLPGSLEQHANFIARRSLNFHNPGSGLGAENVQPNLIALQNQHIRELKAENENIKAKNENLEAQLAAAKEEIARLQAVTRRNEQEMDDLNLRVVGFEEENANLRRARIELARLMRLEADKLDQLNGEGDGQQDA